MEKNLVIIDDSNTIAVSIRFIFEKTNYTVHHATDGIQGEKLINSLINSGEKISIIISDINMPNRDGLEFLKTIKSNEKTKFIPVLMLTSESQVTRMTEAKKAGATGYLVKPFHPEQLLDIVNKFAK
jgi:two-component system chemotaxis response regulator CheY